MSAFLTAMIISGLVLVSTVHLSVVHASTNVIDIISSDTTWTTANGSYTFTGPVVAATSIASLQIADSAMAEGVNSTTYQPINRTQVFTPADTYAYSWIELADVYSPSHNVTWTWLTPNDNIYFTFSLTIPDPGQGHYYPQYYVCCDIYVEGSNALLTPGQWQVNVYIDGAVALVQIFTLLSQDLTPEGIRSAYNVSPLIQSGYTGKNVTVAIINTGIDSTFYQDIQGFDTAFDLPDASVSVVTPFGTQGTNSETPTSETTGDAEFVHAMAPDAHILLVLVGQSSELGGFSYVIDNNAADIATVSPSCYYWGQGAQSIVGSYNSEYAKSVVENITLMAASNDWGSNNTVPWGQFTGQFWTNYLPNCYLMPQYSPYVTAVGGTSLTLSSTGLYESETGWNQSGGGPSNLFQQPAWQTGDGVPNNGYRDIPDIALDASDQTPYTYFWNGSLGVFCGTSAGAPTFAGILADIIQAAGHRIGFLNPTLYSIASSDPSTFHDITQGYSLVETPSGPQIGYSALPGWDFVTGIGSPDSVKLAEHITGLTIPTIPEFPSWIIPSLLIMVVTGVGLLIYSKKRNH
jgi:subtilase family serine protease